MKISKFGKTIIITISVLLFFVALYVYSSLKTNSSGYTKLRENFVKNLTVVTRGTKFDAVIFQGKSLNILKSSFSHNVEFIEYTQKDDMVKIREHLKDKTFIVMWETIDDYHLPKMTQLYRLFFTEHKKTLYAPFEKEAEKHFSWQNDQSLKLQYYLFEKPQPIDFNKKKIQK